MNKRYQGNIGDQDRVMIESITKEMTKGNRRESLATYAKKNGSEVFTNSIFPKDFKDIVFNLYQENIDRENAFKRLFQDRELYEATQSVVGEAVYSELRR